MDSRSQDKFQIWKLASGYREPERISLPLPLPSSLDEISRWIPAGAYTTFRTYQQVYAFHLPDHLTRLEDSARLAGKSVQLDRIAIREAIDSAILGFHSENTRIRINLDLCQSLGDIYLILEPLVVPSPEQYQQGVRVVTIQYVRENPKAKLTGFIAKSMGYRHDLPGWASEGIMLSPDGSFLEGLSSNFFAAVDGVILTAEQNVLSGITRQLVLEEAQKDGIPVVLKPAHYTDLSRMSEAFITSSSRAVLPVVQIDETQVGVGKPGQIARSLLEKYTLRVNQEIEPIFTRRG